MPQLQPAPGGAAPGVRDFTLTMAAAAAEVPTTLPGVGKSAEDLLKEQIRKATGAYLWEGLGWRCQAQSEATSRGREEQPGGNIATGAEGRSHGASGR